MLMDSRDIVSRAQPAGSAERGFQYIAALTNPQIRALLKKDVFQMDLFYTGLSEVKQDNKRFILYRNEAIRRREQPLRGEA